MSINVSETKIETISVDLKSDDVRQAIIEAAKKAIAGHHTHKEIDLRWTPQLVEDGYGGFTVYFRKAELSVAKAA